MCLEKFYEYKTSLGQGATMTRFMVLFPRVPYLLHAVKVLVVSPSPAIVIANNLGSSYILDFVIEPNTAQADPGKPICSSHQSTSRLLSTEVETVGSAHESVLLASPSFPSAVAVFKTFVWQINGLQLPKNIEIDCMNTQPMFTEYAEDSLTVSWWSKMYLQLYFSHCLGEDNFSQAICIHSILMCCSCCTRLPRASDLLEPRLDN